LLAAVAIQVYQNRPIERDPLVPELPAIAADLMTAKTLCEDQVRESKGKSVPRPKGIIRRLREPKRDELRAGQDLYGEARAQVNGCITYLQAALGRRTVKNDRPEIEERLKGASARVNAFLKWSYHYQRPQGGYGRADLEDPLSAALGVLPKLIETASEANETKIRALVGELEKCRFASWDDL
jgi:hypothetical protein